MSERHTAHPTHVDTDRTHIHAPIPRPRKPEEDTPAPIDLEELAHDTRPTEVIPTTSESDSNDKLKLVIVGLDSNIRAQAFEAANAVINEKTKHGDVKGFLKNIWYGNIGREYYMLKEARKAKENILQSGNLLANEGGSSEYYEAALKHRFGEAADTFDGMIREAAGEKRTKLDLETHEDGTPDPEGAAIKETMVNLVRRNLRGEFDTRDDFIEAEKFEMQELAKKNPKFREYLDKCQIYTANLYDVSETLKASEGLHLLDEVARNEKAEQLTSNVEIVLGEGRTGVHGGVERSTVEKIADKASKVPFLNESTVGAAAAITIGAAGWLTNATVSRASWVAGGMGVGAGAIAALRAGRAFRQERDLHEREMAKGKYNVEDLTGKRAQMETTRFATKNATELIDQIGLMYDKDGELRLHDPSGILTVIADAETRLDMGVEKDKNFIAYSSAEKVDEERTDLMVTIAKAKADLSNHIRHATDDQLRALGIPGDQFDTFRNADFPGDLLLAPTVSGLEGILGLDVNSIIEGIEKDEATKDRIALKLKAEDMAKAFAIGFVSGTILGAIAQETVAAVHNGQQGVFEQSLDGKKDTLLHAIFRDETGGEHVHISGTLDAGETDLKLPDGFHMEQSGNAFTVTGPNGLRVDNIAFSAQGNLTDSSVEALRAAGVTMTVTPEMIGHPITQKVDVSAKEWHANHSDISEKVTREWQHNRTHSGPGGRPFDLNELRLDSPHMDKNGNIVINMGRMTADGSFDYDSEVNWKDSGSNPKIAFTFNDQTLSKAVLVDVGSNGKAIITPDHPLYDNFSETGQGRKMEFDGKWTQAVNDKGPNAAGKHVLEVMATDVNSNPSKTFTDTIIDKEITTNYKIELNYQAPNVNNPVLVPIPVPIYGRRGLGSPEETALPAAPTGEGSPTPALEGPRPPLAIGGTPEYPGIGAAPSRGQLISGEGEVYRRSSGEALTLGEPTIPALEQAAVRQPEENIRNAIPTNERSETTAPLALTTAPTATRQSSSGGAANRQETPNPQREQPEAPRATPESEAEAVRAAAEEFLRTVNANAQAAREQAEEAQREAKTRASAREQQERVAEARREWAERVRAIVTSRDSTNQYPLPYPIKQKGNSGERQTFARGAIVAATNAVQFVLHDNNGALNQALQDAQAAYAQTSPSDTDARQKAEKALKKAERRIISAAIRLIHPDVERGLTDGQKKLFIEAQKFLAGSLDVTSNDSLRLREQMDRQKESRKANTRDLQAARERVRSLEETIAQHAVDIRQSNPTDAQRMHALQTTLQRIRSSLRSIRVGTDEYNRLMNEVRQIRTEFNNLRA